MVTDSMSSLEIKIAELEAEIQILLDLEAIYRLRNSYYAFVNEGKFSALPALFTEDASADFGNELGNLQGRAVIAEAVTALEGAFIKLFPHGHVAEVSGDRASGHLFVEGRMIEAGQSFVTVSKVSDQYVRVGGHWLISATVNSPYYATTLTDGWADRQHSIRPHHAP
jgi:hypothetical protein